MLFKGVGSNIENNYNKYKSLFIMKTKILIGNYFLFIPILLFVSSLFNYTFCTDGGCATGINNLFLELLVLILNLLEQLLIHWDN